MFKRRSSQELPDTPPTGGRSIFASTPPSKEKSPASTPPKTPPPKGIGSAGASPFKSPSKTEKDSAAEITAIASENFIKFSNKISDLKLIKVNFPEFKVLTDAAYTQNITSCCAFVLYSGAHNQYVMGHYHSVDYGPRGENSNLFADEFPRIFAEVEKKHLNKAILVGGDPRLFEQIRNYFVTQKIDLVASYSDMGYLQQELSETLCNKHLIFWPEQKLATLYSPIFDDHFIYLKEAPSNAHKTLDKWSPKRLKELEDLTKQWLKECISRQNSDDSESDNSKHSSPAKGFLSQKPSPAKQLAESKEAAAEPPVPKKPAHRKLF
jgi:hypothetical protein